MTDSDKLQAVRARIDQLDEQIQALITERARCAEEVARQKNIAGDNSEYYRPEREADVLRTVIKRNQGPLPDGEMARLFREIMSACLALQHPMTVAFLGPEGTYTQAAVYKQFGHSVNCLPLAAIDEIFREVEAGAVHYGVVPVENSSEGIVNHTLDMFLNSPLKICSEVEMRIHHCLLGRMEKRDGLSSVTAIHAHQQALAQCREWLNANLPGIPRYAESSNAEAARIAAEQVGAVAIAGEAAAEIYQLNVLASNIEDEPDNTTRFLVIGRKMPAASGHDKTSLLLSTPNRPGALQRLLAPLADKGISMTRIESRPSRRGTWDYVFFIDIEGHAQDPAIAAVLQELEKSAAMLKILGSYPRSVMQA
jgi:chorismate mutase/prephenate dehydratase